MDDTCDTCDTCATCRFWNALLADTNWNCRLSNLPADDTDGCREFQAADAAPPSRMMGRGQGEGLRESGEARPC